MAHSDPRSARTWAESVADDALRAAELEPVAVAWMAYNRAVAREFIEETDLPAATRLRLLDGSLEAAEPECCPCE